MVEPTPDPTPDPDPQPDPTPTPDPDPAPTPDPTTANDDPVEIEMPTVMFQTAFPFIGIPEQDWDIL